MGESLSGSVAPRSAGYLGRPDDVVPSHSTPGSLLPRRVNLADTLQYVGHRCELLLRQSLDQRDLVGVGALASQVAHHLLLARWQAKALKVSGDVDRGSAAVRL